MKKEYLKPKTTIVNIELCDSLLNEEPVQPPVSNVEDNVNRGIWDDAYDKLPGPKSVWDDDSKEEEV